MKFHVLGVTSVSACFELDNSVPYYAPGSFDVYVGGALALEGVRTNVFSLFDLVPDSVYEVRVGEDSLVLRTKAESAAVCVKDFGARGDGVSDDTTAIQNAIYACPVNGRVVVPEGTYFIRPLVLKSHMTLELKEGATLLADTVESHFPVMPGEVAYGENGREVQVATWEGMPAKCHMSILNAWHAADIAIVGRGAVDGNAQNADWWKRPKNREFARPKLVFFNGCENVLFHGILGKNSPSWHFHPFFCRNVDFLDIAVEAPAHSPNTDGTDPESCDGVNYIGVRFSVGDDAIAIKSGKMYMGMKYRTPARNHVIRNCLMEHAHGAVVLGSEMSGGVKDLTVSQCLFAHTDRGLRIKTRRGRGETCVVDGVEFSNIRMDNVMTPLVVNMFYFCDPDGKSDYVQSKEKQIVDERTPHLGAFTFRNMTCTDCEWAAGYFYGLPEMPVDSITIENVDIRFKPEAGSGSPAMMCGVEPCSKKGLYFNCVNKVTLKNVSISGQAGEEVIAERVGEVERL